MNHFFLFFTAVIGLFCFDSLRASSKVCRTGVVALAERVSKSEFFPGSFTPLWAPLLNAYDYSMRFSELVKSPWSMRVISARRELSVVLPTRNVKSSGSFKANLENKALEIIEDITIDLPPQLVGNPFSFEPVDRGMWWNYPPVEAILRQSNVWRVYRGSQSFKAYPNWIRDVLRSNGADYQLSQVDVEVFVIQERSKENVNFEVAVKSHFFKAESAPPQAKRNSIEEGEFQFVDVGRGFGYSYKLISPGVYELEELYQVEAGTARIRRPTSPNRPQLSYARLKFIPQHEGWNYEWPFEKEGER